MMSKLFLLFLIFSFIGWIVEIIDIRIETGKLVNRGFLIGPYCPIYGIGGILITLTLTRYYNSPITLFVMAVFICSILEYFTSYALEKIFNARWWDYSNKKFNINGRICLETLVGFGALGCLVIYVFNPLILKILINDNIINVISIVLGVLFIFDVFVSLKIMSNFKMATMQFKYKDNTEEITKKVKELLSSKSLFNKRLINSFSGLKVFSSIKNELERTKEELKNVKKELKKITKKMKKIERNGNKYN